MTTPPTDPFARPNHGINRRQQRNFNEIVLAVIVAIIMIGVGRWLFLIELPRIMGDDEISFFGNLFSEAFGIIITVIIVDRLNQRRADNALREELFIQVGSQSNDFALNALERIKMKGWLSDEDNLLRGKVVRVAKWQGADLADIDLNATNLTSANLSATDLHKANLSVAYLENANLSAADLFATNLSAAYLRSANVSTANLKFANLGKANLVLANLSHTNLKHANLSAADLHEANLSAAYLRYANLSVVYLRYANLSAADLHEANLSAANLVFANLSAANLVFANLSGANLREANLQDAIIDDTTEFDEKTTLPDGIHWTPETDMTRFTDSNHPNFWRSSHPDSPANPTLSDEWKKRLAQNK